MVHTPPELRYAATHEWVAADADGTLRVGISDHAQDALGDVVFVELPAVGRHLRQGELCVTIESVKAAGEVYSPVTGEVVAVHEELTGSPELLNSDPYGAWLIRLRPAVPAELDGLLDAQAYAKQVEASA